MPSPKTTTAAELVANVQELHRHTVARYEHHRELVCDLTNRLDQGLLRRFSHAVKQLAYVNGQLAASTAALAAVSDPEYSELTESTHLHQILMRKTFNTLLDTSLNSTSSSLASQQTDGFIDQLAELRDLG